MSTRCNDTDHFNTRPTLFTSSPGLLTRACFFWLVRCEISVLKWLLFFFLTGIFIWRMNGASDRSDFCHMHLCLLVGLGGTELFKDKL